MSSGARLPKKSVFIPIAFLFSLSLASSSVLPAAELANPLEQKKQSELPAEKNAESHAKAERLVGNRQQSESAKLVPEKSPYEALYGPEGYLRSVNFDDGYRINVRVDQGPNGQVGAVALSGDNVSVLFKTAESTSLSPTQKEFLEKLLIALKKMPVKPGVKKEEVDFYALRRSFEEFRNVREKAFQDYRQETEVYYQTIGSIIRGAEKSGPAKPVLSREEIDSRVAEVLRAKDLEELKKSVNVPYAEKIRSIQPTLYRTYVLPAGQKMSQALEESVKALLTDLEETLRFDGKTSVNQDGNSVEIVIALS